MITGIADEVVVLFFVQVFTLALTVAAMVVLWRVTKVVRRMEREQQYLLDYRKEPTPNRIK